MASIKSGMRSVSHMRVIPRTLPGYLAPLGSAQYSSTSSAQAASASKAASGPSTSSSSAATATAGFVNVNFNDSEAAFSAKTLGQLMRAMVVYSVCTVPVLVKNSEKLIKMSYKILGPKFTNAMMQATFFGHFCGGEDEKSIKPVVDFLQRNGIGSIFDYAAESDVSEAEAPAPAPAKAKAATPTKSAAAAPQTQPGGGAGAMPPPTAYQSADETKGRVYHYVDEQMCDKHMATFEDCIKSVNSVSPTGFAAIKITALGNPLLLKRVSTTLNEIRQLFVKFDSKGTGIITRADFETQYRQYFTVTADSEKFLKDIFISTDKDQDGHVDYIEWSNGIVLENVRDMVKHCKNTTGPLSMSILDEEEMVLLNRMRERVDKLASLADKLGVRLMIDAEHSYFQPAIDHIAQQLSAKYNTKEKPFPIIFNTYQMYLQNSAEKLRIDLERSRRNHTHFAAKIVRGAYMVLERAHAIETKQTDPIQPTLGETHKNYNAAIAKLIDHMARGDKIEVVIASHNQQSIELALKEMQKFNLPPSAKVYFGQLLGMADHLTFHLGKAGYKAYKYVPYGKVNEVMPYLIRRAQENADVLGNAKAELKMIMAEIKRRVNPFK